MRRPNILFLYTDRQRWDTLAANGDPRIGYVAEADGTERLFDLSTDPWEYHGVSADPAHAAALNEARRALIGRMIRIEQPLPPEWPY